MQRLTGDVKSLCVGVDPELDRGVEFSRIGFGDCIHLLSSCGFHPGLTNPCHLSVTRLLLSCVASFCFTEYWMMLDLPAALDSPANFLWEVSFPLRALLLLAPFVGPWILISWIIGARSWRPLALAYPWRPEVRVKAERVFWFQGAIFSKGGTHGSSYRGILKIDASPLGLRFSVLPLWRVGNPPFWVPWEDITVTAHRSNTFNILTVALHFAKVPDVACVVSWSLHQRLAAASGRHLPPPLPTTQPAPGVWTIGEQVGRQAVGCLAAIIAISCLFTYCGIGWQRQHNRWVAFERPLVIELSNVEEPVFINSLEMKFVPVPIHGGATSGKEVLFSIWETRVRDYTAFNRAVPRVRWQAPLRPQGEPICPTDDCPVVLVGAEEADSFCRWLTEVERASGLIGSGDNYRLPSDHEWSCAVGIGALEDVDVPVDDRDRRSDSRFWKIFPWGTAYPPPSNAGNYKGTLDEFEFTSPVGRFPSNRYGLHDLGGNVWEMCEDISRSHGSRVCRGGSWNEIFGWDLQSSARGLVNPYDGRDDVGFRCVLERQTK